MVRVGVIGAGRFGINLLNAFAQMQKEGRCGLAAVCDLNPETLDMRRKEYGVPGYLDYRQMLEKEEMDAVAVATPDPFHREPVLCAAGLGKHVFVEKPMDLTVQGCARMIEACRRSNVLLQVDFHKRFDPHHREVEKRVREGSLGKVEYGYVHMENRIEVPAKWFASWASQSSPAWFLGIHFFDLAGWFLKSAGRRVFATGRKWKLKGMGLDTYDSVTALVEFDCGATVTFDLSWILPEKFEAVVNQGIRLVGENGMVECDTQDRGTRMCSETDGMMTLNPGFLQETFDRSGNRYLTGYGVDSISDFVLNLEHLRRGATMESLRGRASAFGEDGLAATRIAVAVHRSLETGQPENIPS